MSEQLVKKATCSTFVVKPQGSPTFGTEALRAFGRAWSRRPDRPTGSARSLLRRMYGSAVQAKSCCRRCVRERQRGCSLPARPELHAHSRQGGRGMLRIELHLTQVSAQKQGLLPRRRPPRPSHVHQGPGLQRCPPRRLPFWTCSWTRLRMSRTSPSSSCRPLNRRPSPGSGILTSLAATSTSSRATASTVRPPTLSKWTTTTPGPFATPSGSIGAKLENVVRPV